MGSGQLCFYFKSGTVTDDSIDFVNSDGKKSWRGVVGFKSIGKDKMKRIWHFGVSAKPIIRPETLFVVKTHVLFSDDGTTLWTNKDKMGRARRNQCRNWWNDDWRDRLLATMSHLANAESPVSFSLGSDITFTLAKLPALFESPVTYNLAEPVPKDDLSDYEFEEEDDELSDEAAASDEAS